MPRPLSGTAACLGILLFASGSYAGQENPALERIVPVPAGEAIPITDFFRPYLFYQPQLNHAGTQLAAVVSNTLNAQDLVLVDLKTGATDRMSGDVATDIYDFSWLTDDMMMFSTGYSKEWAQAMWVVRIANTNSNHMTARPGLVIGIPENDRLRPIVWPGIANEGPMQIDVRGVRGGEIINRYPDPDDGSIISYQSDRNGELAFAITSKDGSYKLHRLVDGNWVRCPVDLDNQTMLGAGDRPGEIIVAPLSGAGRPGPVMRMDAVTGKPVGVLYQDLRYSAQDAWLYRDRATRKVAGIRIDRRGPETVWIDPAYAELQHKFDAAFPGQRVEIFGSDDARSKLVVRTWSDVNPGAYYIVDLAAHSVGLLKKAAPWLDPGRLRPMKTITYRARDGAPIEAYLTMPAGVSKESPAPLVVYPHGGPWVRDAWGYDPVVQFLASRGYAVFQPNYRGSEDYDWRFPAADRYDFIKMRNDVTDGTNALIRSGYIDRNRIAIMGGSFGGYLALCGAAFEPNLYRCAITLSGVFDWGRVMDEARQDNYFDSARYLYFRRHLGDPKADPAKFDAISPLRHMDKARIPVFIFHGWDDLIASIAESKALVSELDARGIPYEKHFFEREQHGLSHLENAVEIYSDIAAFLDKYTAPGRAVGSQRGGVGP